MISSVFATPTQSGLGRRILMCRAFAIVKQAKPCPVPCPFTATVCWSKFCTLALACEAVVGSQGASQLTTEHLGLHGVESTLRAWGAKATVRNPIKKVLTWVKSMPLPYATLCTEARKPGAPDGPPQVLIPSPMLTEHLTIWHYFSDCVQAHTTKRKGPATIELLWLQDFIMGEPWLSDVLSAKAGLSPMHSV